MKKIFLLLAVVSAFSLASCKKDHTCTCITTTSDGSYTSDAQVTTYPKSTKGAAKANCLTTTETQNGVVWTSTCTLK